MEGNFVADVRLDDSDEVLQLPIVKHRLKELLAKAVRKIALLGAPVIPSSDDTLDEFLAAAGKFFGKDPSKWEQVGDPKVEVTEEDGKRYIKNTGTFTGTELHLFVDQPYYDERLPVREDKPELNFNQKKIEVTSNPEWQECIGDQPWSLSIRRQVLMVYLHAKLEADDGELAMEGCHGFWEMSINKDHHLDIRMDRLAALLTKLNSSSIQVSTLAAAAVWGLATTGTSRNNLSELDVISVIIAALKRSLRLTIVEAGPDAPPTGSSTDMQRALMQRNLMGGMAVLLIDRCCRRPYLSQEPDFATLFLLCKNLEGYADADAQSRRETSAKVLSSLIQRDADARHSLISSGSLKSVLANINPEGPGDSMIQFCMASLLATLVLDDEAMDLIRERGEAPVLFESCLLLLSSTLDKLQAELDCQLGGYYQTDDEPPLYDLALGVRLAEASSQAMWGSAHTCVMMQPIQIKMSHVEALGKMGMDCYSIDQLPLSRVCHCVTATLATLASVSETADLLMRCPNDLALTTLITLVEVFETEIFDRAGHVKAAACAGVAFLTCHPIGAKGDECMSGPYRVKLLDKGAFGALLRAALTSVNNVECDMIVQQAAAIALMYMASMAGTIDPGELAMYSALLMDSDNSEMIEFLMAGMWILLRNPDNRRVLGSSFQNNPGKKGSTAMASKLKDAAKVHDVNDQADAIRKSLPYSSPGMAPPPVEHMPVLEEGDADQGQEPQADAAAPDADASGEATTAGAGGAGGAEVAGGAEGAAERGGTPAAGEDGFGGEQGGEEVLEGAAEDSAPAADAANVSEEGPSADLMLEGQGTPRMSGNMKGASTSGSVAQVSRDSSLQRRGAGGGLEDEEVVRLRSADNDIKRQAEAAAVSAKEEIDDRFDKQLKDNWGLETLVTVGESWLPALLDQDAAGEVTDVPVLKLFEFLVASICLFMIEEKPDPERRELDLFRMSAPSGVQKRTWWTVDAHAPEANSTVDDNTERALNILVKIVGMRLKASWKSLQLSALTLWNASTRNASIERNVVEKGICFRLVDIINTGAWPASLRDCAGGLLEFFSERYSNLEYFPQVDLPEDIEWPYPAAPPPGMVPALAAHINLINTRLPILEYRGCHAIARMCFKAPYRCPDSKLYVRDAKAVSAVLGAVDAVMALLKRVNKRYEEVLSGQIATVKKIIAEAAKEGGEEDPAIFEKDMTTIEATQDAYFVLFASMLNISVLRSVQPMVARKGLMVLLGTNTFLYNRVSATIEQGGDPGQEEKLLHICSSIIQNISLHPQNRTRLYKAELKGSSALEKMIEDAMAGDDDNSTFFTGSYELPPISSPKGAPAGSPGRNRGSPVNHTAQSGGGTATKPPKKIANAKAMRKYSPSGAVLNSSIDSALSKTMAARPKVMFPPIVENSEPVWPPSLTSTSLMRSRLQKAGSPGVAMNRMRATIGTGGTDGSSDMGIEDGAVLAGEGEEGMENAGTSDSRHKFLKWLDNTFHEDGTGAPGSMAGDNGKKTARRQMWDEKGDWLDNEPETSKSLNQLLCKPLNQMWKESPEQRSRHGQNRWEPVISEYRETTPVGPFGRSATKLLTTQLPRTQESLMVAATQIMTTGRFEEEHSEEHSSKRPLTATRDNGRMGLTVLKPHTEVVLQAQMAAAAQMEADEAVGMGGMRIGSSESATRANSSTSGPATVVPLKICMGPQRPRQVMTFEDRILVNDDGSRPVLTIFEHVEGSRVCQGMFPSYQLPNGKQTFMYYSGGSLMDEVHVDAVMPPPRPTTVPEALQQSMPLADVLSLIAKPPGSAPPFIPYKPVPYLVPLPARHTVNVKRPDILTASSFGDVREDNLQLIILANRIIKTQTNTRVEAIEFIPVEEREPWALPTSIFKSRAKEADSRTFLDNTATEEKMFEKDWARATGKEKFTSMLSREHKGNKNAGGQDDKAMLEAVHEVLLHNYQAWYSSFLYYGANSSGDPYHMSLNSYTAFLDECQISDSDSQFIKRSDCDTIFIVCNFQPDKKSAEAQVNLENAMMRYEFLEAIVRIAIAKYGRGQETEDVAEAVKLLLEKNLIACLPSYATLNTNNFRKDRLYNEEVDLVFKKHNTLIKALYSRYRLKPPGGGLRTKVLKIEGWQLLMSDAHLVDSQFTLADSNLAFLWSRTLTIDEIKDYNKYTSATLVDFFEMLARVADMKSLPTDSDLDQEGFENILDWALEKERMEGNEGQGGGGGDGHQGDGGGHGDKMAIFRARESAGIEKPKSRPLYVKLELLLDLMFRRLFYDPVTQDIPFNYDGLLKLVKKIDKDLGP